MAVGGCDQEVVLCSGCGSGRDSIARRQVIVGGQVVVAHKWSWLAVGIRVVLQLRGCVEGGDRRCGLAEWRVGDSLLDKGFGGGLLHPDRVELWLEGSNVGNVVLVVVHTEKRAMKIN